jgi:hypothetical protein
MGITRVCVSLLFSQTEEKRGVTRVCGRSPSSFNKRRKKSNLKSHLGRSDLYMMQVNTVKGNAVSYLNKARDSFSSRRIL